MATVPSPTLAELLQRHRAAAGLTQEELAARARLSARAISDLERGIKHRPHAYTVQRLATALGLVGPDRDMFEAVARPPSDGRAGGTVAGRQRRAELTIYIACAPEDRTLAEQIRAWLQASGIAGWIGNGSLGTEPSATEQAQRQAIRAAQALLLLVSPHTAATPHILGELRIADMYQRSTFLAWVGGSDWGTCVPRGWEGAPCLDARGAGLGVALQAIVATLRDDLDQATGLPHDGDQAPAVPRNPYKGLRPFHRDDAGDYFGRERLIATLLTSLSTQKEGDPRFLALVGPSGAGKSSAVLAGLLPRLRRGSIPGSDRWVYPDPVQPGAYPLEALTVALATVLPDCSLASIRADLDYSARGLHLLGNLIARKPGATVVLVVDQFEELFTLTSDEHERRRFIDLLTTAATEPRGSTQVILTLRADFYDRPMRYPSLGELIEGHSKSMLPMSLADLRAAIEKPASLADVQLMFEQDLVGDLLYEVRGQAGALPLLEFTLDQLFERREGRLITVAAYHELGGVQGALARQAEAVYDGLPSKQHQRLARALFLRLIDAGEVEQATTRRRATPAELLLPDAEQTSAMRAVVDAFINARLLTTSDAAGMTTIEVSHEALIAEWPRLAEWLRAAREDIRLQQTISKDASEWARHGHLIDHLYRGSVLDEALRWAERNTPSTLESIFLDAAVDARRRQDVTERNQQERELELARQAATAGRLAAHRLRYLAGVLVLFLAVATGLAVVAVNAAANATASERREAAAKAAAIAERNLALSSKLALVAVNHLDDQYVLALLLSVEANHLASTVEARGALLESLEHQRSRLITMLNGNAAGAVGVSFSRDGRYLSAVSPAGSVGQWDVAQLRQRSVLNTGPGIPTAEPAAAFSVAAAFSADGRLMAYSMAGGDLALWDVPDRRRVGTLSSGNPGDIVTALAFSPDGKTLAASYETNLIRLWDVTHRRLIGTPLAGQQGYIDSMSFSPEGRTVASGSGDGTVWLWGVASHRAIGQPLVGDSSDQVFAVTFSPDGSILAAASANGGVQLWDVAHRRTVGQPLLHRPLGVYSVAFSHDGNILASGNVDGTIQLWSVPGGQPLGPPLLGLRGGMTDLFYRNGVTDLAFSPDDTLLASGIPDAGVDMWDVSAAQTLGLPLAIGINPVPGVAVSPDGRIAATGGANKTVLLWDLATHHLFCNPLAGHTDYLNTMAFSPDGRILASGGDDAAIRLWDVAHCRALGAPLIDPAGAAVESLMFGTGGRVLVAGNADATIRLWDVGRRQAIGPPLTGPAARPWGVAISHDGRTVASGNFDGTVWLWNLASGGRRGALMAGHTDTVYSVALSPDGRILASGGEDGTVRLWDTRTNRPIGQPLGVSAAAVRSVAFSPDGSMLASAGDDRTIQLWDVGTRLAVGPPLTGHAGGVWGVAFGPNGRTLVSAGTDRTLRLWTIDPAVWEQRVCRLAGRNLTLEEWRQYLGDLPYQRACVALP